MKNLKIFIASVFLLTSFSSQAALSPLSVGVIPPAQFPPSDYTVTGVRASGLWGKHRNVYGLDLGLLGNITEQKFTGLALSGLFNYTGGQVTALGAQIAGLTNINKQKANIYGIQAAAGLNYNAAASSVVGLQLALVNQASHTDVYGVQAGIYNVANEVYGLQIGVINVAKSLHGIQIGLLNFHYTGLFYVSPIINVGF